MRIQELIQQLEIKVKNLHEQYQEKGEQKIVVKFDRTLFCEDFQSVNFYLEEINQTLDKIKRLEAKTTEYYVYLTERLVAQCTVLSDALRLNHGDKTYNDSEVVWQKKVQDKKSHAIHRLPPRERLDKYYEALQKLTDKLLKFQDLESSAEADLKLHYATQISKLQQRRQKALEAIELLEDYLAFKNGQENRF